MSQQLDEAIDDAYANLKRAQKCLADSLDHPNFNYVDAALKAVATTADKLATLENLKSGRAGGSLTTMTHVVIDQDAIERAVDVVTRHQARQAQIAALPGYAGRVNE